MTVSTDRATSAPLSTAQETAIQYVRSRAFRERPRWQERIAAVLKRASSDRDTATLVGAVVSGARVALNFHPDRIATDGRMVAEAMLEDGLYRNQFESKISNASLSAFPGGNRDRWEERLFGGAYQARGVAPEERPKYGGLNLMDHPEGPCPGFGSCHLRLGGEVLHRSTFCFGDSHVGPEGVGTIDAFEPVLAVLFEAAEANGSALGRLNTTVESLIDLIQRSSHVPPSPGVRGRALDDYIEAQVHGSVDLAGDADAIVADPSFQGSAIGSILIAIAERFNTELRWHGGFELDAAEVPAGFRGPAIPVLACRIAEEFGEGSSRLHAEVLGRAARSVVSEPGRWRDWGTSAETLQHIKQLWHVLARYGVRAS